MPVEFEVVEDRIPELRVSVEAAARAAVTKVARAIMLTAQEFVPYVTGALHDSIEVNTLSVGKEAEVVVGEYYAGYVEFGTRFMAPEPYLAPAIDAHAHELPEEVMVGFEI